MHQFHKFILAWNSRQNKFVEFVHLVDFIIKKFVTMHDHMKVKCGYSVV